MNLLKGLSPATILSMPVRAVLAIPAVVDSLPEEVIEMIKGMSDTQTLRDIPTEQMVSIAMQVVSNRPEKVDGGDGLMAIPNGGFTTCKCGKTTFHKTEAIRFVRDTQ